MTISTATQCAVILVHYNNAADTLVCLRALYDLRTLPACVMVADNHSPPEALGVLREGWDALCRERGLNPLIVADAGARGIASHAVLLRLPRNAGFAGGNNAALRVLLRSTSCTSFWLLNNDTEPIPQALNTMCSRLNDHPEVGLCGSTLLYAHAPEIVQAAGGSALSLWTGASKFLCGGMKRTTIESLSPQAVRRTEREMTYVVGASCLVRREVFEQVGLLPEEYFLYYEDAAFCLNATRAGFALAWAPDSVVLHKEGGSTRASAGKKGVAPTRPAYVDYLTVRNRVALVRRYNPWALPVVLFSLMGVYINRVRRGQANRLGLILRAAWHGLIGEMGPPPRCYVEQSPSSPQPPAK